MTLAIDIMHGSGPRPVTAEEDQGKAVLAVFIVAKDITSAVHCQQDRAC